MKARLGDASDSAVLLVGTTVSMDTRDPPAMGCVSHGEPGLYMPMGQAVHYQF